MFTTHITCHECRNVTRLYVTEWPPKVFVCTCHRWYRLVDVTYEGEPHFQLAGLVRNRNELTGII
jgi:hypothetical protein